MVQNLTLGIVTEKKNVFKNNEMSKNASLPRYENLNLPDFRVYFVFRREMTLQAEALLGCRSPYRQPFLKNNLH